MILDQNQEKTDLITYLVPKILSPASPKPGSIYPLSFLYFRFKLIGKHGNPAISVISQNEAINYSFIDHISSFPEAVTFLFSRIYDIFEYWQSCFNAWHNHPYNIELDVNIKSL